MDLSKLTLKHIIFIPHSSKENYYAVDTLNQLPAQDYLDWLHEHDGIYCTVAFAFYYSLPNHLTEFIEFLKEKIATDYFTDGNKLIRDFYCFENFNDADKWIGLFQKHREAQFTFWLNQSKAEKKETSYLQSIFDF